MKPHEIADRIAFCKTIHKTKLVISPESPIFERVVPRQLGMLFKLQTETGKFVAVAGVWTNILASHHEHWQRHVVVPGIIKQIDMIRIGVELTTPHTDPFDMLRPGWYGFKIHIPSHLPLSVRADDRFEIHESCFT